MAEKKLHENRLRSYCEITYDFRSRERKPDNENTAAFKKKLSNTFHPESCDILFIEITTANLIASNAILCHYSVVYFESSNRFSVMCNREKEIQNLKNHCKL